MMYVLLGGFDDGEAAVFLCVVAVGMDVSMRA